MKKLFIRYGIASGLDTQSFANQIIGLARQWKKEERRYTRWRKFKEMEIECEPWSTRDIFVEEAITSLTQDGYFRKADAIEFVTALRTLIENSTPSRSRKKPTKP